MKDPRTHRTRTEATRSETTTQTRPYRRPTQRQELSRCLLRSGHRSPARGRGCTLDGPARCLHCLRCLYNYMEIPHVCFCSPVEFRARTNTNQSGSDGIPGRSRFEGGIHVWMEPPPQFAEEETAAFLSTPSSMKLMNCYRLLCCLEVRTPQVCSL